jgi:hypothetical protein
MAAGPDPTTRQLASPPEALRFLDGPQMAGRSAWALRKDIAVAVKLTPPR